MIFSSHPMKGIEDAVYVLEKIYKKYPDIKIILFGFEPKPKNINFKFTYLRGLAGSSVKEVYAKSDIFLSTSIQEGFNNPPSEAMAAKCAVLATKVGSTPHTTEHMINGVIVEPRDTAEMEKFLSLLIEDRDLRISLSENGFKSIQQLTWDDTIKKSILSPNDKGGETTYIKNMKDRPNVIEYKNIVASFIFIAITNNM